MTTKPGFKTSEFWLTVVAAIVGLLLASGAFAEGSLWAQIIGYAGSVLASLGYSFSRGLAKTGTGGAAPTDGGN